MIKTAIATKGLTMGSIVADTFAKAKYLLLADAETGELLETASYSPECGDDRAMFFANKAVDWECEAIICGPIERKPFIMIADKGAITRFNGSGLQALDALNKMQAYDLDYLTDFIGGTGCEDREQQVCGEHDFDTEE